VVEPPRAASSTVDLRDRFNLSDMELLLAFGYIHTDKGLIDLVRALSILRKSGITPLDNVRLVVAGTIRPRHGLFRLFEIRDRLHLARVLHLAHRRLPKDSVTVTGYVPDSDVAAWFQTASTVILPYRRTEQSGVASIACALKVPVLTSSAGGLGEQIANPRWTVPPGDPEKLALVLSRFLKSPPHERASAVPSSHDADLGHVIAATLDKYHKVVQSRVNAA
jgi:glycosyltransferase involved in cell wall biosynthesis